MKSFIASLRNLVLPFGVTTGTRIVLDGVNGKIVVYNSTNVPVITLDSATDSLVLTDPTGNVMTIEPVGQGGQPTIFFQPKTAGTGPSFITQFLSGRGLLLSSDITTDYGEIELGTGFSIFHQLLSGATSDGGSVELVRNSGALIRYYTNGILNNDVSVGPTLTEFARQPVQIDVSCTVAGNPVRTAVGSTQNRTSVGPFTAETITDSVTVNVVDGRKYRIEYGGNFFSTVAGDDITVRIREDNVTGTQLDSTDATMVHANKSYKQLLRVEWIAPAGSTGTPKTFVVTGVRQAGGTGNITRQGGALIPAALLTVDQVSV